MGSAPGRPGEPVTHFLTFLNNSWNQIWPNLVAGLFPSTAVVASHVKRTNLAKQHHAELKAHISQTVQETPGPPPEDVLP